MDKEELKGFVNKIFAKKGYPPIKKFGAEFADGIKFQILFNLMYDEKIDCRLTPSALIDERLLNWGRINSQICFNYLQQRFYLVEPTMKSLAKGTSSDCIFKLIKVLINTQQHDYQEALAGDTSGIGDIVDQLETDRQLFGQQEAAHGTVYNTGVLDDDGDKDVAEGDIIATNPEGTRKMRLGIPSYVEDQINTTEKAMDDQAGYVGKYTGPRSSQFDFLLQSNNDAPSGKKEESPYFKRQDTYNRYIGELKGEDFSMEKKYADRVQEIKKEQKVIEETKKSPKKKKQNKKDQARLDAMSEKEREELLSQYMNDVGQFEYFKQQDRLELETIDLNIPQMSFKPIQELKALSKPPQGVIDVCQTVLMLLYGRELEKAKYHEILAVFKNPKSFALEMNNYANEVLYKDPTVAALALQKWASQDQTPDQIKNLSFGAYHLAVWLEAVLEIQKTTVNQWIRSKEVKDRIDKNKAVVELMDKE